MYYVKFYLRINLVKTERNEKGRKGYELILNFKVLIATSHFCQKWIKILYFTLNSYSYSLTFQFFLYF